LAGEFASGTIVAKPIGGGPYTLTMNYVPSSGVLTELATGSCSAGSFTEIKGVSLTSIPTTNADSGLVGFVAIQIVIPAGATIQISCIQAVSVPDSTTIATYIQETTPRQIDHLFHYFQPAINYKPIPSYLVGWDFPLNPTQFGETIAPVAALNYYAWDQTIIFQSVANAFGITRPPSGSLNSIQILSQVANAQFAMIQYLDAAQANEILCNSLSVNVKAYSSASISVNVSLWYTSNAQAPLLPLSLVTTLDPGGHPSSVAAGWTELPRIYGPANATLNASNSNLNYGFNGWEGLSENSASSQKFFAIVVGSSPCAVSQGVAFVSVSLVPGDIPTIPAPQTKDQVLKECEFYYEKSTDGPFLIGTPGAQYAKSQLTFQQTAIITAGPNVSLQTLPITISYKTEKRKQPLTVVYDGYTGASSSVRGAVYTNGLFRGSANIVTSGNFTTLDGTGLSMEGTKALTLIPFSATSFATSAAVSSVGPFALLSIHYSSNAQIGVV
jgi:hypothetical protein